MYLLNDWHCCRTTNGTGRCNSNSLHFTNSIRLGTSSGSEDRIVIEACGCVVLIEAIS